MSKLIQVGPLPEQEDCYTPKQFDYAFLPVFGFFFLLLILVEVISLKLVVDSKFISLKMVMPSTTRLLDAIKSFQKPEVIPRLAYYATVCHAFFYDAIMLFQGIDEYLSSNSSSIVAYVQTPPLGAVMCQSGQSELVLRRGTYLWILLLGISCLRDRNLTYGCLSTVWRENTRNIAAASLCGLLFRSAKVSSFRLWMLICFLGHCGLAFDVSQKSDVINDLKHNGPKIDSFIWKIIEQLEKIHPFVDPRCVLLSDHAMLIGIGARIQIHWNYHGIDDMGRRATCEYLLRLCRQLHGYVHHVQPDEALDEDFLCEVSHKIFGAAKGLVLKTGLDASDISPQLDSMMADIKALRYEGMVDWGAYMGPGR